MPPRARILLFLTVAGGIGVAVVAVVHLRVEQWSVLLCLVAASILTEGAFLGGDRGAADPIDEHAFSFSSAVHLAAVMILGAWPATLVAASGVLVVDPLRREPWQRVLYNSSVFALSALAGGGVFALFGGTPGHLTLPGAFVPICGLVGVYTFLNAAFVSTIIAWARSISLWPVLREAIVVELPAAGGEGGLGAAAALFVTSQPWGILMLLPLVATTYLSQARLGRLRSETWRALETFARLVDERDPYTFDHSSRVADYAAELAGALRLPEAAIARLRRAGRLHDLGKIAIDASILRKPGRLQGEEWLAMRNHPRLGAGLLRAFGFAAREAAAVEYHHERYDGEGYYGVAGDEIPPAAHFIAIADTFDAMTTDRPYRAGLPQERALAEIERGLGSQFHPTIGRAFVAKRRGLDPLAVVGDAELEQIRSAAARRQRSWPRAHDLVGSPVAPSLAAGTPLLLVGLGHPWIAIALVPAAAAAVAVRIGDDWRARAAARALAGLVASAGGRRGVVERLAAELRRSTSLTWAGLVSQVDAPAGPLVDEEWPEDGRPPLVPLGRWLAGLSADPAWVTQASADPAAAGGTRALPLRGGHLVLRFARRPPRHVALALDEVAPALADALALEEEQPLELAAGA